MSKGKKPRRAVPKGKLNGRATRVDSIIPPPPGPRGVRRPTPRPRLAMLVTAVIIVVALIGIALATRIKAPAGSSGQIVDGIPCQDGEQLTYHVHAHLTILDNGQPIVVPAQVGIPGSCFYWLHTHDTSGVIHVEAPQPLGFTLGQFFDIWGQPLTSDNVAGHRGTVTAYVDQARYSGDPRAIPLKDHASIVLEVGNTSPVPAPYDFGDLP